ncbi:MAG TPA: LysR family transcriptional regulator [Paraburkholderia sp.]|nr:LysR family transcriptional regulator [Paraburkholderia sp.]
MPRVFARWSPKAPWRHTKNIQRLRTDIVNHLFSAMRVFLKVVDTQQFSQAAQQLELSPARVTRYVDDLESHLGVKLLQRSTRRTVLTDVGAQYARGCRTLLSNLAMVEERAMRASTEICGELRVVMLSGLAQQGFAALFAEYRSRYPDVSLSVTSTEAEVDMLGSRFDVGILNDGMVTSITHVSRALIHSRLVPVAAPAYLTQTAAPQHPDDLVSHRLIGYAARGKDKRWCFSSDGAEHRVRVSESFVVDSRMMQKQLALTGAGIALLPECLIEDEIRDGALVRLLEAYRTLDDGMQISLIYPSRDFLPARVRAFIDLASGYTARGNARECASAKSTMSTINDESQFVAAA